MRLVKSTNTSSVKFYKKEMSENVSSACFFDTCKFFVDFCCVLCYNIEVKIIKRRQEMNKTFKTIILVILIAILASVLLQFYGYNNNEP